MREQAEHGELTATADIYFSVYDRRDGELHGRTGLIAIARLRAVIELLRYIGSVVCMQDGWPPAAPFIDLQSPQNRIRISIGRHRRTAAGESECLRSFACRAQLSRTDL